MLRTGILLNGIKGFGISGKSSEILVPMPPAIIIVNISLDLLIILGLFNFKGAEPMDLFFTLSSAK